MAWRIAESLIHLRNQINIKAPNRSKANDGAIGDGAHAATNSDHNPWVRDGGLGVVTAIDITHDLENECDAQALVNALVASRDARIKYIIWNKQIISSTVQPWKWRPYRGKNPHTKHFHLSVLPNKKLYDSKSNWSI
jgi:hypothetical protein